MTINISKNYNMTQDSSNLVIMIGKLIMIIMINIGIGTEAPR